MLARKHAGPSQTSMEQVTQVAYLTIDPSYLLSTRCNVYIHLTCDLTITLPSIEIFNYICIEICFIFMFNSGSMCWNSETGHLIF